jgi:hypothetical protein
LGKEERYFIIVLHVVIVDVEFAGEVEACVTEEVDVALHTEYADTHLTGLSDSIVQQLQTIALALIVGMDADRAKGPSWESLFYYWTISIKDNLCF